MYLYGVYIYLVFLLGGGLALPFNATIYLPMETLTPQQEGGSYPGYVVGSGTTVVPGILGNAVYTGTQDAYVNYGEIPDDCFREPNLCSDGYTVAMWIRRYVVKIDGTEFYISNGGQQPGSTGFAISGARVNDRNILSFLLKTRSERYFVTYEDAPDDRWMHIAMTWSHTSGLTAYIDGVVVGVHINDTSSNYETDNTYRNLTIGRQNDWTASYSVMSIDEFFFWDSFKTSEFVESFYKSYSTMHMLSFEMNSVFKVEERVSVVNVEAIHKCTARPHVEGPHPCRLECMWYKWCSVVQIEGIYCHFFNIVKITNLTVPSDKSSVFVKV